MAGEDLDTRLRLVEQRLERLERATLGVTYPQPRAAPAAAVAHPQPPAAPPRAAAMMHPAGASTALPAREPREAREATHVTNVLGWSGAVALVLAAAYLIRVAISAGWLTPAIQIASTTVLGSALVSVGIGLRRREDEYLGLLPAAGIAILFLSVYGAHLFYHLIDARLALIAVIGVCALSLALCSLLNSVLYALFAVAGSYSAPFLIHGNASSIADLAIYFSAWSVTFTIFSIVRHRRLIYLLAAYLALIGFDAVARAQAVDWHLLLMFQLLQFAIFGCGTVYFSIQWREPLDESGALRHVPALLLFYALQYAVLSAHAPGLAPWASLASLFALLLLYVIARAALRQSLRGGQYLLGAYVALVLFHAIYIECVPSWLAPWIALGLLWLVLLARSGWKALGASVWAPLCAVLALFLLNFWKLMVGVDIRTVPAHELVTGLYAATLYVGYWLATREPKVADFGYILIYAGHTLAMSALVQFVAERIVQSVGWGLLGLATLAWALTRRDALLGKSSLLIFAATGLKVVFFDLHGAAPIARVLSLATLGVTFYVGGLLYRRVATLESVA
jgi:uncharacterized membrane protein